jgi:hypothetical protein
MQKRNPIFRLIVFLPVLFWLVAQPMLVSPSSVSPIETAEHSKSAKQKSNSQATFYAEQQVYQVSASLSLDFPSDWTFTQEVFSFFSEKLLAIKLPVPIHRTQLLSILFTQFIATLAP